MARYEQGFKEIIVLAKMHKVVAAPIKLAKDIISNAGVLSMKDVSIPEIYKYTPEALKAYAEYSKARGELVKLQIEARATKDKRKVEAKMKQLEAMDFHEAFKHGFMQTYSTDMMVKEFDTITGLQKHIDDIVHSFTKDKDGNPNEIHNAVVKWMNFGAEKGFTVDNLIASAVKLSKTNDTSVGAEMINMANRLKSKRETEDVARYVSELIGSPSSEIVRIGSSVMVLGDAVSKYILAKSLLKRTHPDTQYKKGVIPRNYTVEEAYEEASRTFIDYRRNLPSEIKALSDYGVLMFPSFTFRMLRVLVNLAHYHPATAISGFILSDLAETYAGVDGTSIFGTDIVSKIVKGNAVYSPTSIIDWDTVSPFLP